MVNPGVTEWIQIYPNPIMQSHDQPWSHRIDTDLPKPHHASKEEMGLHKDKARARNNLLFFAF